MSEKIARRAFVVGAYLPNGGAVMAYHLGRILGREFGFQVFAVTVRNETADHGIHDYDFQMPLVSREKMEREITKDDVLIVNPSYSSHQFGWRIPGFKISYVQGFTTFTLLDRKFDHYVAVSDFVGQYLHTVYGISARVIPPFINFDKLPPSPPWSERSEAVVLPYRKGYPEIWDLSYRRLRDIVAKRAPEISFAEPIGASAIPQQELLSRIGSVRYLLMLSAAEGFGLVPVEAMAVGTVVIGYDGFGGRHYMRSGDNCMVAPYAEIERVAELLITAVRSPKLSASMALRGQETAIKFSYQAFRQAWIKEFSEVLNLSPLCD